MKQSITEFELEQIKKEYFEKNIIWNKCLNNYIEKQILESFSKEDLLSLKNNTEIKYFKLKSLYLEDLKQEKDNYLNLSELEENFIEQIFYYFNWWYELQKTLNFIEKVENFYTWNHTSIKDKKTRYIDFRSIPIVPFISKFITVPWNLKNNFICPFPDHKEKTWSFHIYEKTNTFKCFWCWRWWWAVNFVEWYFWIDNKEACQKVLNIINNN